METKEIVILIAVVAVVGFRLYKKYVRKDQTGTGSTEGASSSFSSSSPDDDYEPYSKK